jgi:hypothetical protein
VGFFGQLFFPGVSAFPILGITEMLAR